MSTLVKGTGLERLTDEEFLHFTHMMLELIYQTDEPGATVKGQELGIFPDDLTRFEELHALMCEVMEELEPKVEKGKMLEAHQARLRFMSFLFGQLRIKQTMQSDTNRMHATPILEALEPFAGFEQMSRVRLTLALSSIFLRLLAPKYRDNMRICSLFEMLDVLHMANNDYLDYSTFYAIHNEATHLDECKELREELSLYYQRIVARAFSKSLVEPTGKTYFFSQALNEQLKDMITNYKRRLEKMDIMDDDAFVKLGEG